MTQNQIQAIKQHIEKPKSCGGACACTGPQALFFDGYGKCGVELGPHTPLCGCAMRDVEEVNGVYYRITEVQKELGFEYAAEDIGPVGGPYTVDQYGKPGFQPRVERGADPYSLDEAVSAKAKTLEGRLEAFKSKKLEQL